jgi:hypothetical protein
MNAEYTGWKLALGSGGRFDCLLLDGFSWTGGCTAFLAAEQPKTGNQK